MTNLSKVKIIEEILNQRLQAYILDRLKVELIKQGEDNFDEDELAFGEAIEKLIKDGKIKICFPYSNNGNKREIGIISKKRELWQESYENMKKELAKAGIN